jgi:colanic acid/amylovoran biosynthesis protein
MLKLGLCISEASRIIRDCKVFLDVSAGDSFSDIYGGHRFDSVCFLKSIMAARNSPTILLPQTYGPFKSSSSKLRASKLVRSASMVWARDEDSGVVLRDLLEGNWDSNKHRVGVDMAFALPVSRPPGEFANELDRLKSKSHLLLGFNVSGLIYNAPELARQEFGLNADYCKVVDHVARSLLEQNSNSKVILVPHVNSQTGDRESDNDACDTVLAKLPAELRNRVLVAPRFTDPRHVKWVISQFDWFCGTRMHATIAGLSTGVATASIAYSMKTRGVFESCGMASQVFDPRLLDTDQIIQKTLQSVEERHTHCNVLKARLPETLEMAERQMDMIADLCTGVLKS